MRKNPLPLSYRLLTMLVVAFTGLGVAALIVTSPRPPAWVWILAGAGCVLVLVALYLGRPKP